MDERMGGRQLNAQRACDKSMMAFDLPCTTCHPSPSDGPSGRPRLLAQSDSWPHAGRFPSVRTSPCTPDLRGPQPPSPSSTSPPQASERILDAPDIVDDYYLNLLDWSSQNVSAVALGPHVYLWHASTGTIQQLPAIPPEEPNQGEEGGGKEKEGGGCRRGGREGEWGGRGFRGMVVWAEVVRHTEQARADLMQ